MTKLKKTWFAMKIKDKRLYFCYALPCAQTFVKRGKLKQQDLDKTIKDFSEGKNIDGFEKHFLVANRMLEIIASKMGKNEIDEQVIHQYYLIDHDKIVDARFEEMKDFNPIQCKIKIGKVLSVSQGKARVKTPFGISEYRTDFVNNIKPGDTVSVHYDFISEKIDKTNLKNILKSKPIL